jgi:hypothetical protein
VEQILKWNTHGGTQNFGGVSESVSLRVFLFVSSTYKREPEPSRVRTVLVTRFQTRSAIYGSSRSGLRASGGSSCLFPPRKRTRTEPRTYWTRDSVSDPERDLSRDRSSLA